MGGRVDVPNKNSRYATHVPINSELDDSPTEDACDFILQHFELWGKKN